MAIKQAKIITVTSVKGGTGKTIFTLGLAGLLKSMKYQTLIIDFDLYGSGIGMALNANSDSDVYKMAQDISNNNYDVFENYTTKYDEYIDILPAPIDPRFAGKIDLKYIELILDKAKTRYDVILIDTNYLLTNVNLVTLDHSDEIIYVLTDDLLDLKNMKTMVSIYNDMGKSNYTVILNRALNRKNNFSNFDVSNMIDNNIDYILADDFYIANLNSYLLSGKIYTLDNKFLKKSKKTVSKLSDMLKNILER